MRCKITDIKKPSEEGFGGSHSVTITSFLRLTFYKLIVSVDVHIFRFFDEQHTNNECHAGNDNWVP